MQTVEELWQVYQEWKRLTEQEAAAIQGLEWRNIHSAQQCKRGLQAEIIRLTDKIKADFQSTAEQRAFDQRLRQLVNELILLESQNNLKIQACINATEKEKSALDATTNRLRQVHNRYVPFRNPIWENLS